MRIIFNIFLAILNVGCIIIGSFCDSRFASWIVCVISTTLFVFSSILNAKLNKKVDRHEQALTVDGK